MLVLFFVSCHLFLTRVCAAIVEKNPKKFKIDEKEIKSRKAFIEQSKNEVKVCTKLSFRALFFFRKSMPEWGANYCGTTHITVDLKHMPASAFFA